MWPVISIGTLTPAKYMLRYGQNNVVKDNENNKN